MPSSAKLKEIENENFVERYKDFIELGYQEWKKIYDEFKEIDKKAVLFLMVDDTKNCDSVAKELEKYNELKDSILVIHTNRKGDIQEKENNKELNKLRQEAKNIDNNKYKAIVSVMMLKEGWDVKNVTTIVGLRAYTSKSNILPEQTLGRGLRRIDKINGEQTVSVIGSPAFMDFVRDIKNEGVELQKIPMGSRKRDIPRIVSVKPNLTLDIKWPVIKNNVYNNFENIKKLDVSKFNSKKFKIKKFSEQEKRNITFDYVATKEGENPEHHKTEYDNNIIDIQTMIRYYTISISKELKIQSYSKFLYKKIENFISNYLFDENVNIQDTNTIRNLSEPDIKSHIFKIFKQEINKIISISKQKKTQVEYWKKTSDTKTFLANPRKDLEPISSNKSIFTQIIPDSKLEKDFANKLEFFKDIISYAKNDMHYVGFTIPYKNSKGGLSYFYPDFFVKLDKKIYIVETKGFPDIEIESKMKALKKWCEDVNETQNEIKYDFVYIDNESFEEVKNNLSSFQDVVKTFNSFKK